MARERSDGERRVVPFSVPPSRRTVRSASPPDRAGTILLFTGVRYERIVDDTAVIAAASVQAGEHRPSA